MEKLLYQDLTYKIIGAARQVHFELGPGFLESIYEDALCYELKLLKISFQRQAELKVKYKDIILNSKFRADLIVDSKVLVENKAIKTFTNQDEAQLINYLKVTGIRVGFIFNFGAEKFEMLQRIL